MKILCACEESQAVTIELRKLGHEAYSCDLYPCSGGYNEWHIQGDVLPLINGRCTFITMDGITHIIPTKWDMLIAFPPCTYLSVTGNRWFNIEKYGEKAIQRYKNREIAKKLFMSIAYANCDKIIIENPVGIMSSEWRKPNQIIQPYQFGDPFEKRTCLWTKGVPDLQSTNIVKPPKRKEFSSGKTMPEWYANLWSLSPQERAKTRSKTFPGIAKAIATQLTADFEIYPQMMLGEI